MSTGMRRRAPQGGAGWGGEGEGAGAKPRAKATPAVVLERMDVFTKLHDEDKVHTSSGATISLLSWLLVIILVLSETREAFFTATTKEHLVVDPSPLGDKLNITVDLTFHALTCADVHVDAMDVAGDNQMKVEHNMLKQRLSAAGEPLGRPFLEDPTDFDSKSKEKSMSSMGGRIQKGEGCHLKGFMLVNKVAGNFHIAFGDSIVKDGRHIHQFIPSEAPFFNVSHKIHHVSFGDEYPGRINPLDGKEKFVSEAVGTGLFQYFIKVIPTHYKGQDGKTIRTNRLSVTERFKPLHREGQARLEGDSHAHDDRTSVLPGVFFIYDLSPFAVEVSSTRPPLSHFLVKLCAISGGVFSVSRILDNWMFYSGMGFLFNFGSGGKTQGFITPR